MLKKLARYGGLILAALAALATFGYTQRRRGRKEGAVEQKFEDETARIENLDEEDLHDEITRPL